MLRSDGDIQASQVIGQVAETTGTDDRHLVGYDSPTQFNREYRRLFGAPPGQDAARLRVGS